MTLAAQIPATLEAATEIETAFGGRVQTWAPVATVWVALTLSPLRETDAEDRPPVTSEAALAVARDHPAAAADQRLVVPGEPPWRVAQVRRGEPAPGRMTLVLDRLL